MLDLGAIVQGKKESRALYVHSNAIEDDDHLAVSFTNGDAGMKNWVHTEYVHEIHSNCFNEFIQLYPICNTEPGRLLIWVSSEVLTFDVW